MKKYLLCFFLLLLPISLVAADFRDAPVLSNGRFRPVEAHSRIWLHDLSHKQTKATVFIWKLHQQGFEAWIHQPLFWVHHVDLKEKLKLAKRESRFSYWQLTNPVKTDPTITYELIYPLIRKTAIETYQQTPTARIQLTSLHENLYVSIRNNQLVIQQTPSQFPYHFLKVGDVISEDVESLLSNPKYIHLPELKELDSLLQKISRFESHTGAISPYEKSFQENRLQYESQKISNQQIATELEKSFPLTARIRNAGNLLKMLPLKNTPGEWVSLNALALSVYSKKNDQWEPISNFTPYPNPLFEQIQREYLNRPHHPQPLFSLLIQAYQMLEGTPYQTSESKALHYPSLSQLHLESIYYRYPWIRSTIICYMIAIILLLFAITLNYPLVKKGGWGFLILAFLLHTFILAMRCWVLQRPPVSNMFETIIYVPWISILLSLGLKISLKNSLIPICASIGSVALLIILRLSKVDAHMDNVQAVLDSQYWLIVHVLMVVGSYGAFVLCGILGHLYLSLRFLGSRRRDLLIVLRKAILQTMYLGVLLLIPGTLLGGIWAAESWGRFWDWDPKESWAFISSCIYLVWIHAFHLGKIRHTGLAIGSIIGLISISFTWYGVNYILGVGLHSYGFGNGGESYYYLYLLFESLFLLPFFLKNLKKRLRKNKSYN